MFLSLSAREFWRSYGVRAGVQGPLESAGSWPRPSFLQLQELHLALFYTTGCCI